MTDPKHTEPRVVVTDPFSELDRLVEYVQVGVLTVDVPTLRQLLAARHRTAAEAASRAREDALREAVDALEAEAQRLRELVYLYVDPSCVRMEHEQWVSAAFIAHDTRAALSPTDAGGE